MKRWLCCAGLMVLAGVGQAAPETALSVRVNAAAWLNAHASVTNKSSATLAALGISDVALAVMVEEGAAFVAARIVTTLPDAEAVWLSQTNVVQLESVSAHEYKWIPSSEKNNLKLPAFDNLRIRFSGGTVTMADASRFSFVETMDSSPMEQTLLRGSAQITRLLEPLCKMADQIIDAQEEGFGKAMIGNMWKSMRAQIEAIEEVPTTSVTVVSTGKGMRKMELSFEYNDAANAAQMQSFFGKGDDAWKDPAVTERELALKKLTDTPHFRESKLEGNELGFFYEWPTPEDSEMLQIIGQAMFGGLSPMRGADTFPVNAKETLAKPNIGTMDAFDAVQFERDFRAALFFSQAWSRSVDFEVDYLSLPNVDLLKATITNASVIATDGEEIVHPARPGRFQYDAKKRSARISIMTDSKEAKPESASFTLELNVPSQVEIFSLTPDQPLIERGDQGCCLIAISNSVVRLRSKNLSLRDAQIYARDAAGDYLRYSSSVSSESNYRATYKGLPAVIELVLPARTETISLDFSELSVTKESKLNMPSSPTNSVVTRYSLESPEKFCDPNMAAFSAGSMVYVTNAGWKKNGHELKFPKPEHVEVGRIGIKTYLAGTDQFVSQGQKSGHSYSSGFFKWNLENTNALKSASAIFGEINAEFWSGTGSYTADHLSSNLTALIDGQTLPAVSVEHNVVWVSVEEEGKVLGVQAFDATGRSLKKDNRTSSSNSKRGYFFWGNPVKATVDYASEKVHATVPFHVEITAGGLNDITSAKAKVAPFEEIQETLQRVAKNSRNRYGTLLAANYYAHDHTKEPMAEIPVEIAQSDPVSATIFGYELKPYKGYYFKKILTDRELGQEMPLENYEWAGGVFQAKRYSGVFLAIPVEPTAATVLSCWNNLYVNYGDFSTLDSIDPNSQALKKSGWFQIR